MKKLARASLLVSALQVMSF